MPRTNKASVATDVSIGARIRSFRVARGLSQTDLGSGLGITFQQIQKYEKGTNRVSGSRLIALCDLLQVKADALLGSDAGITMDEPEAFAAMRDHDVAKAFVAIGSLAPDRRRAVMKAIVALVAAFGGSKQ
jgi:transcriptional regulator with XRE-family HTH domain